MTLNGNVIATNNTTFYYDEDNKEFTFATGNKLTYKESEGIHDWIFWNKYHEPAIEWALED